MAMFHVKHVTLDRTVALFHPTQEAMFHVKRVVASTPRRQGLSRDKVMFHVKQRIIKPIRCTDVRGGASVSRETLLHFTFEHTKPAMDSSVTVSRETSTARLSPRNVVTFTSPASLLRKIKDRIGSSNNPEIYEPEHRYLRILACYQQRLRRR